MNSKKYHNKNIDINCDAIDDKKSKDNNFCCDNINLKKIKDKIFLLNENIKIKNKLIKKLKNKLIILKKENNNIILRCKADIENMRKLNEKNINNIYKYSLEKFSKELLSIIDNLKSSILVGKDKNLDPSINYEGINLTLKNFLVILKKFGILNLKNINQFDPNYHEAISIVYTNSKSKDNKIIEVLQDGYMINDRLLRPAIVKIFKYSSSNDNIDFQNNDNK